MQDGHLHIIVWAAEGRSDSGFSGVTMIDLIANTALEAVTRAQVLMPGRQFYWVNNIVEHHDHKEPHG